MIGQFNNSRAASHYPFYFFRSAVRYLMALGTGSIEPMEDPGFEIGLVEVAECVESRLICSTRGMSSTVIVVTLMSKSSSYVSWALQKSR